MMRRRVFSILLICALLITFLNVNITSALAAQYAPEATNRVKMNINRDWKFKLGDQSGAQSTTYNDSSWSSVGLPHSFGIPYFAESTFYVGYGWYRKHLNIDSTWTSRRISVEFEAAFQVAEVYVNNTLVGTHKGGYTGFSLDITNYVHSGDNVLAVRLNNLWNAEIAPRAGEHNFNGGIYRNVYLVLTDPLHTTWYGTFATTPTISASSANVNMKTEVKNDSSASQNCTVKTTIVDAAKTVVTTMQSNYSIAAGATYTFDQTSTAISNPHLWSPEDPYMYTAYTTVYKNNVPVDDFTTPFGMRWLKFTADQGFFLNGKHVFLRGANVHQDHAGWGDAVTVTGINRDVKLIKDCGMNFIRGSHYPHSPFFAESCDKLGVLFWSELDLWGSTMGPESGANWKASAYPPNSANWTNFENNVKQQLQEMIRINRNHPSIIVWSMGNELFFTDQMDRCKTLVKSLVSLTHTQDPTRPAGLGGTQRSDFDKLADVAGYNGDGAKLYINPGIPNLVAEYGSHVTDRPGNYSANFGDCQNVEYAWRSGQSLWCGFDHGSIQGDMGKMGMVDYFRLPKRSWYWYRNEYLKIAPPTWPAAGTASGLKLTADKTTITNDGTDDCQLIVKVVNSAGTQISNSPDVKLSIVSGPGQFPTGSS
ncbi:MAG: glycoside hydrolase family 2 TIM barrel-domain containing protein, partial [Bacillota bacterium]|nr:glycoside hydrolase family 2 TIM barrel-domain containing protein [Bacillota bacterium]